MPASDPVERTGVYDAMNATLAGAAARFRSGGDRAPDYGRGENYVARQVDRWSKQYRVTGGFRADRGDGAA